MPTYSGLWNNVHGESYSLQTNRSPQFRRVSQALRRRGLTVLREVLDVVAAGASINGAAAVTRRQIANNATPGSDPSNGGVRSIETVTVISAASTVSAAQATQVDKLVDYDTGLNAHPTDRSGNGGGGDLTKMYAVN